MNRRSFLGLSSAALAAFTLDPERALWVPGQRSYFDIVAPFSPYTLEIPSGVMIDVPSLRELRRGHRDFTHVADEIYRHHGYGTGRKISNCSVTLHQPRQFRGVQIG